MASFEKAIRYVLRHEGGFVDHPDDPGGATNFGISLRWMRKAGVDGHPADLTRDDAVRLYRKYFWAPYAFSDWKSQVLATRVFDATVNMGPGPAMRLFQRALRSIGYDYVQDDAVYGPVTARALSDATKNDNERECLAAFRSEMAGRYRVLVARNPSNQVFLEGWLKRAYDTTL